MIPPSEAVFDMENPKPVKGVWRMDVMKCACPAVTARILGWRMGGEFP
jgi:hypothetical protein